jgi:HAMP domain-containing protein
MMTRRKPAEYLPPVKETQAELLRGAAQSLRDYADTFDSTQPRLERQIAMCEKAADDVERLAESLRRMATP